MCSWVSYIKVKGPLPKCFLLALLPGACLNAPFFSSQWAPMICGAPRRKAPGQGHSLLRLIRLPFWGLPGNTFLFSFQGHVE